MASSLLFLHFHLYWYEEPLRNWKKKETDIDGKKCVDGRIEKTI